MRSVDGFCFREGAPVRWNGCGKAISLDDLFLRDQPSKTTIPKGPLQEGDKPSCEGAVGKFFKLSLILLTTRSEGALQ